MQSHGALLIHPNDEADGPPWWLELDTIRAGEFVSIRRPEGKRSYLIVRVSDAKPGHVLCPA